MIRIRSGREFFFFLFCAALWEGAVADKSDRITFTGRGEVNLTLDCQETNYQNPNWTMGQIYSSRLITCAPVETKVLPVELSAVA
jgi:hypothetical protein